MNTIRIGEGYDVHRLCEGRALIIGGVEIPYERGLDGHSDADVLLHALMDAILGALAEGDIGKHFPDSAEEYHGISSIRLLICVREIMEKHGYGIGNADMTIVAQRPKMAPYIDRMRENIAFALGCPIEDVSVKATTEERLGFTGREEGIAAHATVLLVKQA